MISPKEIQSLIRELLGPEVNNPHTGIVNAQELADFKGITYDQAKAQLEARRAYASKRNPLIRKLQEMGFSLEDMGFEDRVEHGKSAFDQYGKRGILSRQGIMNGWEYDWKTGLKRNVITSDRTARDRWKPIEEHEKQKYQETRALRNRGFKTYSQQMLAKRLGAQGLSDQEILNYRPTNMSLDDLRSALANNTPMYDDGGNAIIRYGDGSRPTDMSMQPSQPPTPATNTTGAWGAVENTPTVQPSTNNTAKKSVFSSQPRKSQAMLEQEDAAMHGPVEQSSLAPTVTPFTPNHLKRNYQGVNNY